ncbi:MAG: YebC/PmpR family DNA-binding transcriptional regulator [Pseudomonadota bacterium]
MSGHSKWSTIKHKKGAADAKRGKIFTKLIKEIIVAARMGGGDVSGNPRLRAAIGAAKTENMPKDNIERAIKKGTGDLDGVSYEEVRYEGYGPGGVAVLVEALTDNKNRTVSEVRHIFTRTGGNMGEAGSVSWMFEKKGLIIIPKGKINEDAVTAAALEAGAEDVVDGGDTWDVRTGMAEYEDVKKYFEDHAVPFELAELTMIPQTTMKLSDKQAEQMIRLMELLEDHDDIQHVYANFDIDESLMEAAGA